MSLTAAPAEAEYAGAQPRRATTPLLVAAVVVLVASSLLLLLGDALWRHAAGYVLSTFVLIGLVARYRWAVVRRRADRSYAHTPALDRVATATVLLGLAVAAAHVWPIATELAR